MPRRNASLLCSEGLERTARNLLLFQQYPFLKKDARTIDVDSPPWKRFSSSRRNFSLIARILEWKRDYESIGEEIRALKNDCNIAEHISENQCHLEHTINR